MKNKQLLISILTIILPLSIKIFAIKFISESVHLDIYGNIIIIETICLGITQIFLSIPIQAFNRFYNESNKKDDLINELKTTVYISSLLITIILPLILLISFPSISLKALILSVLYCALLNIYSGKQNILIISLKRKKYFIFQILESILKILLPIICYVLFLTIEGYLIGLFIGALLMNGFIHNYTKSNFFKLISIKDYKKYFLFSYPILITTFAAWIISFSDRIIIKTYLSDSVLGEYSLLAQLAGFGQIIGSIFILYVNPIIFKLYEENKIDAFIKLKIYIKNLVIFSIISFLIVLTTPIKIISYFFNEKIITENYDTFIVLVASIIFAVLQNSISLYFILEKKLLLHAKFYISVAIINLILNFYLVEYGILGLAFATLISYIMLNVFLIFSFVKYLKNTIP
jgi:O-antigen/teichoic acid export membrane protein